MSNPLTQHDYEYIRSKRIRNEAGIDVLDSMPDIDIIELYRREFDSAGKKPLAHSFDFNNAGTEFIITQIGGFYVHSELRPGANRDIEIMRHHLGVNKYKTHFDEFNVF